MSEINGPKFSVNQIQFNGIQKPAQETEQEIINNEEPKLKDFSDPKAEVLGRSMLVGTDDVNHNLKAILDNPQIAENSDKMFEASYKALEEAGVKNPYEKAATFSTGQV